MTYLELVQTAMKRAKVRAGIPTTLSGAVDAALSFKEYVGDAWRELQEETPNWWFRQRLDQTMFVHPAYTSDPSTEDMAILNFYPDSGMTGTGLTVTYPSINPWNFGPDKLWTPNAATGASDYMVTIGVALEANTKYYMQVVHDEIASPDREYCDVYFGGVFVHRFLAPGTKTIEVTTGSNPDQTIGFDTKTGYKASISNIYIARAVPSTYVADDEHTMPSGLETINYRTCSIYTTAKTDETPVARMDYEVWRTVRDTLTTSSTRPEYVIERPDGVLQFWPVPDQLYTFRYDGVWDIDEMLVDSDTPGSNVTGGTQLLPDRYQWVIVYDACRRYYEDHEDAEGIEKMQNKYLAQRARLSERQTPPVHVRPGVLTGWSYRGRRYW